ncbi:hypothetical protein LWC34_34855 [Kibdelosporangium philippinense]|uniref:Secreted protein n=1 Tax=Kibdelosporangium philippinense TaxID=211113 RepID=A0ABS8ZJK1_9PSEU|nr:hypothetical protein [Kibdelosporangium philippinense]MCE7007964.1 hypothetical protein [Kibdelosporangium philippinense]
MPSYLRRFALGMTAAAVAAVAIPAATAQADPPPTRNCNPNVDTEWYDVISAQASPTVTHFRGVVITPGTTGSRTETLTRVDSVTTSINANTEFSTTIGPKLFASVTLKVGFAVQNSRSTTDTTQTAVTWNFNAPGQYGLYKGTRRVMGEWSRHICARTGNSTGVWVNTSPGGRESFVTFADIEEGTVSCAKTEPQGSLRDAARRRIGC